MTIEERKSKAFDEICKREAEASQRRVELLNDPESHKLARALQDRLVQCCIDFINETKNTDICRVIFTADCLQGSAKYGEWSACTDSTCEIENEVGTISFSA